MELIRCEICGQEMSEITWRHCASHKMTLAEYKAANPNSPTMSPAVVARKKAAASARNEARKGVPRSAETIERIKSSKKNNPKPAWNKGIAASTEARNRMSAAKKAKYASGEIKHWNTGNTTPDEVRDKIRATALSQQRRYSPISAAKRRDTYAVKTASGWVHHNTKKLQLSLSPESLEKFNSREWLYDQHIVKERTISSICVELGLHWYHSNKTIRSQLESFGIPIQYWHQSSSNQQRDMEDFITELGVDIEVKNRRIIPPYELDIYIPSHNIAIEYCGLYWHSNEYKDIGYHKMKHDLCDSQGVRLYTIFSDEWLNKRSLVSDTIAYLLGKSSKPRIFARDCSVEVVSGESKKAFFDTNHIQGDGPSSINIGLAHHGELVACMGVCDHGNGRYLVNRFATASIVPGAFSKILTNFKRLYDPHTIVTFADLRWSKGELYANNGFTVDKKLPPDYAYVVGESRIHKFNFRHKNLPRILDIYDPSKSESENVSNAGIPRIYDCGKLRYVWRK